MVFHRISKPYSQQQVDVTPSKLSCNRPRIFRRFFWLRHHCFRNIYEISKMTPVHLRRSLYVQDPQVPASQSYLFGVSSTQRERYVFWAVGRGVRVTKFAPLLLPRYKRYDITNQNIPGNFLILHATTVLRKSEMVGEKTVGSSWPDPIPFCHFT